VAESSTSSERWLYAYVGAVIVAGTVLLALHLHEVVEHPYGFAALLALASLLSALKIHVPLARGWATMSTSFAALLMALLTLGYGSALAIAAVSGWVQSAFHSKTRSPLYRHIFNAAMLALSVGVAGGAFRFLGGTLGQGAADLAFGPLLGATTFYFLTNSLIVSTAVALSTNQRLWRCWHDNFLWTAPGYFLTAGIVALGLLIQAHSHWGIVAFVLVPLAFIYHSYKVYFGRLNDEQLRVQAMADLHAAARDDLAAEKERLAVTLRSIGDAVITTDLQGKVTMLNNVAEQLTGYSNAAARDRAIDDVLCLWDSEGTRVQDIPLERILTDGRVPDEYQQASLVTPDGARLSVQLTGAPMSDGDGQRIGVVLVLRDVTESVRLMQERVRASKLESLGVLAGGIAHDFNNVLTAVVGNIALARSDETVSRETAAWLEEAERACLRARTLTHQLLTFSRGGDPVKRPMHIGQLVESTVRFATSGSNIRSSVEVPADLWPVEADEGQLEQVVHNIVLNAKQAMPRGGHVEVRCHNVRFRQPHEAPGEERQFVRVSITDHGTGIPAEHLERIFDPYFTTKAAGTGLGLAVSHTVVHNHGGFIKVDTDPSRGTTFHVYLPRSTRRVAVQPAPPSQAIPRGAGRILVMDDERAIATVTASMLRSLGYQAEVVSDGEMAVERYAAALERGAPFDAVVMDLTVPGGMGGAEALALLRELDPGVVAIVMSGYADTGVLADYQHAGFAGRLAKPFSLRDLATTVHDLLVNARSRVPHQA
jgi:PAS domain S-box-containing protein